MEYKHLGTSDLNISRIGFGCMSLQTHSPNNERLLKMAYDSGINFFDTADLYDKGENERIVGKALKEVRDKIHIGTKVGNQWRKDGNSWDWNPSKAYILQAVDESLLRLQTDYIDLYQLHGGTIEDPFDETLEAFELLKEQGKIRHYGISSIRPNVIQRWLDHSGLVSNMMQYSLLDRRPEEQCLDRAKAKSVGILTRGNLAKGLLANKPASGYLNYNESEVEQMGLLVHELSQQRTPTHTSLRFVLGHPAVSSAVVGIRTEQQLMDAVKTFSTPNLTDDEYQRLTSVLSPNQYSDHRMK